MHTMCDRAVLELICNRWKWIFLYQVASCFDCGAITFLNSSRINSEIWLVFPVTFFCCGASISQQVRSASLRFLKFHLLQISSIIHCRVSESMPAGLNWIAETERKAKITDHTQHEITLLIGKMHWREGKNDLKISITRPRIEPAGMAAWRIAKKKLSNTVYRPAPNRTGVVSFEMPNIILWANTRHVRLGGSIPCCGLGLTRASWAWYGLKWFLWNPLNSTRPKQILSSLM
jgi:hypothetical protein